MNEVFEFLHVETMAEFGWVMFGLAGQLLFTARFIVQWVASEREKRSVIPLAFWYFSVGGGLILFAYALYRKDPVFVLGQSMGLFIYLRNLWLIHAERRRNSLLSPTLPADRAGK
ncbi:lipid-A-disaccharide synthase N-terminal domain-containing protein [Sulfitobacter sp. LCG007]